MAKDGLDRLAEEEARGLILKEAGQRRSERYVAGLRQGVEEAAGWEQSPLRKVWLALELMGATTPELRGDFIAEVLAAPKPRSLSYLSRSDLRQVYGSLEWLWPGWLVKGSLALIGGEKGTGKSHALYRIFATLLGVTNLWPDGTEYTGDTMGEVAFIDLEARWQVNDARMTALGLDDHKPIHFAVRTPPEGQLPKLKRWFDDELFSEVAALARVVSVIAIDGFGAGLLDEENKAQYVSGVLTRLQEISSLHGALIVVTHHLRKKSETIFFSGRFEPPSIQEFRGSSQIISIPLTLMVTDKNADHRKRSRWTLRESNTGGSWHESSPNEFSVGLNCRAQTPEEFVAITPPPHPEIPLDSKATVQEKVLGVLAEGGGMRQADLERHLELEAHAGSIHNALQGLVKRGKITRIRGEYFLATEGDVG